MHQKSRSTVNRKRVRRLMQLIGLEAIYRRPNTSKPNPGHKVYPYLLRGLEINRVNQVWATDITYIPTGFPQPSWTAQLSNTLEVDFCVAALEEALSKGRPQISSPRPSPACCWRKAFKWHQGPVYVFVERLCIRGGVPEGIPGTEARKGIGVAFYNQERPHQALGYRSPGQVFQQ